MAKINKNLRKSLPLEDYFTKENCFLVTWIQDTHEIIIQDSKYI